jgi:hypothetical protein
MWDNIDPRLNFNYFKIIITTPTDCFYGFVSSGKDNGYDIFIESEKQCNLIGVDDLWPEDWKWTLAPD